MKVSVIIPYKVDRGWLKEAVASVPPDAELILAQGEGNWPQNFNKALKKSTGDLIRWLHEDDMLTTSSIFNTIETFEYYDCDFIHGNAYEIVSGMGFTKWIPKKQFPTLNDMLKQNYMHSTTLVYRRDVFEKVGLLNESPDVYSFEEFEFNLRCLMAKMKVGYCDAFLAYYRRHPKQCIRTVDKQQRKNNRQKLIDYYL